MSTVWWNYGISHLDANLNVRVNLVNGRYEDALLPQEVIREHWALVRVVQVVARIEGGGRVALQVVLIVGRVV